MSTPLAGRTALITGSTQGLGLAIARRLAAAGANIVLSGLAEPGSVAMIQRELEAHGIRTLYSDADLSRPKDIARMVEMALAAFGTVDIVINNAVVRHEAPVETFAEDAWDKGLAVNLSAAFHAIRLTLPAMRKNGWGRIINIGSVFSFAGAANRVAYVTTKTALLGLTRAVALETAGADITVNCICPGTAETPIHAARIDAIAAAEGIARQEAERRFLSTKQPTGRFIGAEGVAGLIAFLCSEEGRDITGAALPIDGGWTAS